MKKVSVNKEQCITCGMCYSSAPDVFASDSDGTSKVIKEIISDDDAAITTIENCPTGALKMEDVKEDCECENCECENCECNRKE